MAEARRSFTTGDATAVAAMAGLEWLRSILSLGHGSRSWGGLSYEHERRKLKELGMEEEACRYALFEDVGPCILLSDHAWVSQGRIINMLKNDVGDYKILVRLRKRRPGEISPALYFDLGGRSRHTVV